MGFQSLFAETDETAQSDFLLNSVVLTYEQGDYQKAVNLAQQALQDTTLEFQKSTQISLHTYLAFSYVALEEREKAKEEFSHILDLDESFTLNPEFVSPKIIQVFREVKETKFPKRPSYSTTLPPGGPEKGVSPLLPWKGVFYRSSLLPGWGQSFRGERKKGKILKYSFLTASAGLISTHIAYLVTHNAYLNAKEPGDIEKKYKRYDFCYRTRTFFISLTAATYLYNIMDALLTESPQQR